MGDMRRLLEKLAQAKQDVSAAEADLQRLFSDLKATPRAEKTTVSLVIEEAFTKLRAAKVDLAEIEEMVASDVD